MSPRPGVEITSRAARAARGEPTDTGVLFIAGITEQGPAGIPKRVTSLRDYTNRYGGRIAAGMVHDALDVFFSEGGAEAWVSRVVGPAPVRASFTLPDRAGAPINTARVHARDVGAYANGAAGSGLAIEVADGTEANTFRLVVWQRQADGTYAEVERWDNLTMADPAAASYAPAVVGSLAAPDAGASRYIVVEDLASATVAPNDNPAVLARTNLAGGTDDNANAADAHWLTALNAFAPDLGPGQIIAPGRITAAAQAQLIDHARLRNRTAYLDTGLAATEAAMIAVADAVDDMVGAEFAGVFGGHVVIPGLTPGTTRSVPASAYAAGRTAALDAQVGNAGMAPAGDQGAAQYALDVVLPPLGLDNDAYQRLNEAGVNMVRAFRNRGVQLYGFRTVSNDPEWIQLTAQRLRMSLVARLGNIALRYDFRTIDGRKQLLGEFNGALVGELMRDYGTGVLYGMTPEEAFRVQTDDPVNTDATAMAGEVNADVYARFSPFAELVKLSITKVPVTGRV